MCKSRLPGGPRYARPPRGLKSNRVLPRQNQTMEPEKSRPRLIEFVAAIKKAATTLVQDSSEQRSRKVGHIVLVGISDMCQYIQFHVSARSILLALGFRSSAVHWWKRYHLSVLSSTVQYVACYKLCATTVRLHPSSYCYTG